MYKIIYNLILGGIMIDLEEKTLNELKDLAKENNIKNNAKSGIFNMLTINLQIKNAKSCP